MLSAPPTATDARSLCRLLTELVPQGVGARARARLLALGLLSPSSAPEPTARARRLAALLSLVLASCGGEPFTLATDLPAPNCPGCTGGPAAAGELDAGGGAPDAAAELDAALDLGACCADSRDVDSSRADRSAIPPSDDAAAGLDARADGAREGAAPPGLCCSGARAPRCASEVWSCFAPGTVCSATYYAQIDGGGYQSASCDGSALPCGAPSCEVGSPCLYVGSLPGTLEPGAVIACP